MSASHICEISKELLRHELCSFVDLWLRVYGEASIDPAKRPAIYNTTRWTCAEGICCSALLVFHSERHAQAS